MQNDWRLVLLALFGLIFSWMPSTSFGEEVFQQSKTGEDFDFSGFDSVFLAVTLPEDELFISTLRNELGSRGTIKVLKSSSEEMLNAMALSNMWLFVSLKPIHSFPLCVFETSVRTSAQTTKNKVHFNGVVWEELSVLKDEKESIKETLQISLRKFLGQYFKTNPKGKGKVIFYLAAPSHCEFDNAEATKASACAQINK